MASARCLVRAPNSMPIRIAFLAIAGLVTLGPVDPAVAQTNPAPPPGPVGVGTPVVIMGEGADYTRPDIAARLARDGEGEAIAWDFVDNDARPFATAGQGTDDAVLLVAQGTAARLILIRQAPNDPQALGRMIGFAMQTPARILVWPGADPKRPDWPILAEAAKRLPNLLFIIPQNGPAPDLPNILAVPATTSPNANLKARQAAVIATARAAEHLAKEPALTAAALKLRLLNTAN